MAPGNDPPGSHDSTFGENLIGLDACRVAIAGMIDELLADIAAKAGDRHIPKVFVKVKFADFTRTTRECVCAVPVAEVYHALLAQALDRSTRSVRLLGVGVRFVDVDDGPSLVQPMLDL